MRTERSEEQGEGDKGLKRGAETMFNDIVHLTLLRASAAPHDLITFGGTQIDNRHVAENWTLEDGGAPMNDAPDNQVGSLSFIPLFSRTYGPAAFIRYCNRFQSSFSRVHESLFQSFLPLARICFEAPGQLLPYSSIT